MLRFIPLLITALVLVPALDSASAAVIAYTNNFSGSAGNGALTHESTDAQWSLAAGSYRNVVTSATVLASTASLSITNAGSTPYFEMTTQFTVPVITATNSGVTTIGLGLFSTTNNFSGVVTESYYLADFVVANAISDINEGRLRVVSVGAANADFSSTATTVDDNPGTANVAITAGTTYTLRLYVQRTGSALDFSFGIYDATGNTQIGTTATASDPTALTGNFFGYRNRYEPNPAGTITVNHDNFGIVPEPASAALLLFSLTLLAPRRRA
jgi:hypothetical protein